MIGKIEALVNKLLNALMGKLASWYTSSAPKKIKSPIESTKNKVDQINNSAKKVKEDAKKKVEQKLAKVKEIDIKGKIDKTKAEAIEKGKSTKENLKQKGIWGVITLAAGVALGPFKKVFTWASGLTQGQIVAGVTVMALGSLGVLGVYTGGRDIAEREAKRVPASIKAEPQTLRPQYYKKRNREVKFGQVILPVNLDRLGKSQSIAMDITVETETEFSANYIKSNSFVFTDVLMNEIQPIISGLVLNEEGKKIIKDKVIESFNNKLKNAEFYGEKVQGKISSINIVYLLDV